MSGAPNIYYLRSWAWILLTMIASSSCMGKKDQKSLEVEQPWGPLLVIQGRSAILPCVLTNDVFDGPTEWFKGKGMDRELIYSDKNHSSARAQRVNHSHRRNMTIVIRNITTQDDGVYYCVKFHKNNKSYTYYKSGLGTRLSVALQCPEDPGISILFFVIVLLGLKMLLLSILAIYIQRKKRV